MGGLQALYDSHGFALWLSLVALFLLLALWLAFLQARVRRMTAHHRRLGRPVGGGDLNDVLDRLDTVTEQHNRLQMSAQSCLQRVGVVRFNPFTDVGGDQSFSVALLDAKGDGLVISSLFGRRESRVYLKPVERGQSKYALSEEEDRAIRLAEGQRTASRAR